MALSHSQSDLPATKSYFERRSGWITAVAVIVFAAQRLTLLSYLTSLAAARSALAAEVLHFLYGEPPYSILDTLLGFYVPDEGLLFLLQPHNLLLALAQAVHFGVTLGVVYGSFWVVENSSRAAVSRGWPRTVGCLTVVALIGAGLYGLATSYARAAESSTLAPPVQGQTSRPTASFPRANCDRDAVQTYIYDTYEVYQTYWPYVERLGEEANPIGELVKNGKWWMDVFHQATTAAQGISTPSCALEAHADFINGWAALSLAAFQADVGNPDLAAENIEASVSHFDRWNSWINSLP